jgi:hypothetical protein
VPLPGKRGLVEALKGVLMPGEFPTEYNHLLRGGVGAEAFQEIQTLFYYIYTFFSTWFNVPGELEKSINGKGSFV